MAIFFKFKPHFFYTILFETFFLWEHHTVHDGHTMRKPKPIPHTFTRLQCIVYIIGVQFAAVFIVFPV